MTNISRYCRLARWHCLEDRVTPAVTSLASGLLTIDLSAVGEAVSLSNNAGTLQIVSTAPITGGDSFAGVTRLVVTDTGNLGGQSLTLGGGTAYLFADGLDSQGVETVVMNTSVSAGGTSKIQVLAPQAIIVNANVTGGDGGVDLKALGVAALDTDGITVQNGAVVSATGLGPVTLHGTGSAGSGERNYGVHVVNAGSTVTSGGGSVSLTGIGGSGDGGRHYGIALFTGATVTSGGAAGVSITGQGGNAGGIATNFGFFVSNSLVTSGGMGNVEINGTGGTGAGDFQIGVRISTNSQVSSGGGNVMVTGQGGVGLQNLSGVFVGNGGKLTAGGMGNVSVTGLAGSGTRLCAGVVVSDSGSIITSNGGKVEITGVGNLLGADANRGITTQLGGVISSGGTGSLRLDGSAGAGPFSAGVLVNSTNASIMTTGGSISITASGSPNSAAFEIYGPMSTGGNAPVSIVADSVALFNTINAGNGTVTIQTRTAGTVINLGGGDGLTGSPLTLGIDQTELNLITAGTIRIGRDDATPTGSINITADLTRSSKTDFQLVTGGSITTTTGSLNTAGGAVLLQPGLQFQPARGGVDFTASTVSLAPNVDSYFVINGPAPDSQHDRLNVAGSVDLTGSDLVLGGTYLHSIGEAFTIVQATNITGTFNALPDNATISFNGRPMRINYTPTAVMLTSVAPPSKISQVTVNDGSAQRSRVTSLVVRFNNPPLLPGSPADGFQLKRQSDNAVVGLATSVSDNNVTLTFTGGPVEFGSLADGRYTLTVLASQIANLDGDGNGTPGDDYTLVGTPANGLFRLFGDGDGDGTVNSSDFLAFRLAFLSSSPAFDFDGNGSVNSSDFLQFRLRFLQSV